MSLVFSSGGFEMMEPSCGLWAFLPHSRFLALAARAGREAGGGGTGFSAKGRCASRMDTEALIVRAAIFVYLGQARALSAAGLFVTSTSFRQEPVCSLGVGAPSRTIDMAKLTTVCTQHARDTSAFCTKSRYVLLTMHCAYNGVQNVIRMMSRLRESCSNHCSYYYSRRYPPPSLQEHGAIPLPCLNQFKVRITALWHYCNCTSVARAIRRVFVTYPSKLSTRTTLTRFTQRDLPHNGRLGLGEKPTLRRSDRRKNTHKHTHIYPTIPKIRSYVSTTPASAVVCPCCTPSTSDKDAWQPCHAVPSPAALFFSLPNIF